VTPLVSQLSQPRSGHTATLLPDGSVLIVGGNSGGGRLATVPELFDPQTATFFPVAMTGAAPRFGQTATLLTDGRVLIAGGVSADGSASGETEIWDVARNSATPVPSLTFPRTNAHAELLADGRVLITGGTSPDGSLVGQAEAFDPAAQQFFNTPVPDIDLTPPFVAASLPASGATDVAVDARVGVRFSQRLITASVTAQTVTLTGSAGSVDAAIVPAENGRLVFVSPRAPLESDAPYHLVINGVVDWRGVPMPSTSIVFSTAPNKRDEAATDQEAWTPEAGASGWRTNRPDSLWQSQPPLQAPPGQTAVAGQVLRLDGKPLPDVTLTLEGRVARSDRKDGSCSS
jgi:hypothetical protein